MSRQILALAVALLGLWLVTPAHGSGPDISITITSPNASVPMEHTIQVQVRLTNTSDHQIQVARAIADGKAEVTYSVAMSDITGRPVQRTHYGDAADKHQLIGSVRSPTLQPGETLTQTMELTKLFRISKAGTYTIRVGRRWPEETGKMEWSNTLTITVTK